MNSSITPLSILAGAVLFAGTAFAGPGDAYGAGFASRATMPAKTVTIALSKGNAPLSTDTQVATTRSVMVPNFNPKIVGGISTATGYQY